MAPGGLGAILDPTADAFSALPVGRVADDDGDLLGRLDPVGASPGLGDELHAGAELADLGMRVVEGVGE